MTKEQHCPKKSCKRTWEYTGKKRKGAVVRCPDCDGKVKLAAILTLVLLTGVGTAYAVEQTVDVPFDNWIDQSCMTNEAGIFICTWTPSEESVFSPPTTMPDETIDEEEIIDEIVNEPEPEETMTREEREIQRMIDKITLDLIEAPDRVPDADRQLLELLLRAQDKCEFGIEEGQPIQTYQIFAIPEGYFYPEDTDFAKYNLLGKITKLVEACTKWTDYKAKWLGQEYANIAEATANYVPWEPTATIPYNVTITDEYMNRALNPHDFIEEAEDAAKFMCSIEGKQRRLCPEGIGSEVFVYDSTNNPAMKKFNEYQDAPENAKGEPRYSVKTDPKCAILASYIIQWGITQESGEKMLQEAGCK